MSQGVPILLLGAILSWASGKLPALRGELTAFFLPPAPSFGGLCRERSCLSRTLGPRQYVGHLR